jgi:hypothetical protein
MGPIDIFRLRDGASLDLPAARELGLWGDFPLSTAFIRELAVFGRIRAALRWQRVVSASKWEDAEVQARE